MKKFTQIIVTIAVFLLTQTVAFSQAPTDFGSSSAPTDTNATDVVPIDTYLWILFLLGLVLVFLKYKTLNKA
jgi:hypothetical protein